MRVLFLSSMYERPGAPYAGQAIHRQAVELMCSGIDVRVVCPIPRFSRSLRGLFQGIVGAHRLFHLGDKDVDGIPVTYLPYPNPPLDFMPSAHVMLLEKCVKQSVNRLRNDFPFDLIHAHHLFPVGYVGLRVAASSGVPIVVSAVGSDVHTHPKRSRRIKRLIKETISESNFVSAVSQSLADDITALETPQRSIRVVHMGVDAHQFSPNQQGISLRKKLGIPARGIGILTVSRLVREKGIFELIDAFSHLSTRFPDVWLTFVGDGPLRDDLQSQIHSHGLDGRVFIVGAKSHTEIPQWLNAADIFALASYNEGLPNVVLEAMACALPVVAADVGGVSEAVDHGVSGFLVPARDVKNLEEALASLIRSPSARRNMGAEGHRIVQSKFNWDRTVKALYNMYRDALTAATSS